MGKKRVGESSKASSLPKKYSKASLSSQAPSRTKGTKEAYPLILPLRTRGLTFVNEEQRLKYETLSARKTSKQKFCTIDSLGALGMLDDVAALLSNLGWMKYVEMSCVSHDRFIMNF